METFVRRIRPLEARAHKLGKEGPEKELTVLKQAHAEAVKAVLRVLSKKQMKKEDLKIVRGFLQLGGYDQTGRGIDQVHLLYLAAHEMHVQGKVHLLDDIRAAATSIHRYSAAQGIKGTGGNPFLQMDAHIDDAKHFLKKRVSQAEITSSPLSAQQQASLLEYLRKGD